MDSSITSTLELVPQSPLMASRKNLPVYQRLLDSGQDDCCPTTTVPFESLEQKELDNFAEALPLGLSAGYWGDTAKIAVLAISDGKRCLIVEFPPARKANGSQNQPNLPVVDESNVLYKFLTRDVGEFYAFDMAPLSLALYIEQKLRIKNAVDIQSGFPNARRFSIASVLKDALGDEQKIFEKNLAEAFNNLIYNPDRRTDHINPAQRAWLAHYLTTIDNAVMTYGDIPRIDTAAMDPAVLDFVAKVTVDSQRSDTKKPSQRKHEFEHLGSDDIKSTAFKNRFVSRGDMQVRAVYQDEAGSFAGRGTISAVVGKSAHFSSENDVLGTRTITSLISIGREAPTTADMKRNTTLLKLLQGIETPDNAWVQNIWFNKELDNMKWPDLWFENLPKPPPLTTTATDHLHHYERRLNASQQHAVNTMLSQNPAHCITLIQGPPGTGKTSVIAFFVQMAVSLGSRGIWLVAQSNVAVKNIAEKLISVGFDDFRLLVSNDFITGWHDHLYSEINHHVICSREFPTSRMLIKGCKVILCTISMLAHTMIEQIFTHEIPVKYLIVDEASQIHVGDFIHVFYKYYRTLRKICFIGDDKQLPPYGQEDAVDQGLPSIFEVEHLRPLACFLNTQYRMPPQIGVHVSELVYDSLLNSNPGHPITNEIMACHFVDVDGREQKKEESFWNEEERDVIIRISEYLENNQMKHKIISPYDGQRNAIESRLKYLGMDWGNKCFNVDSFQGNEEDYIIISLVRSRELGFLKNLRRTNVMLTRFKKGMLVVTSKKFILNGAGRMCMAGDLAQRLGSTAWLTVEDIVTKGKCFGSRKIPG